MRRSIGRLGALAAITLAGAAAFACAAGCSDSGEGAGSSEIQERLKEIRELGADGGETAVMRLEETAVGGDSAMAVEAVWGLAQARQPWARQALRTVVKTGQRAEARHAAIQAICRAQGDERDAASEGVLRSAAKGDPSARVRAEAAAAFAETGGLEDVEFLVHVAVTDTDVSVQSRAVGAIERLVGVRFRYDPRAPAAQRQEALERVRTLAPAMARKHRGRPRSDL